MFTDRLDKRGNMNPDGGNLSFTSKLPDGQPEYFGSC